MSTQTYTGTLVAIECHGCGQPFGLTEGYYNARRRDHKTFYCPNGCGRAYLSENREERLGRLLDDERRRAASAEGRAERIERSRRAYKAQVTKVKRRISNGVCPCCNRTFKDLAAHMETKHPEYAAEPQP